jgi:hypothetical protein
MSGGVDATGAREGHDDAAVGELRDGPFESARESLQLVDEGAQDDGKGTDELALAFGFERAGERQRCATQSGEQLIGASVARVRVLGEECRQAFDAELGSAVGCGIAIEEGEANRRVDGGKDRCSSGPEGVQQAAQLIGQGATLSHQVVACAKESTQSLDLVGGWVERGEAMAIGAQQIGQDVGVAWIALAAGSTIARPRGFDDVWVDRHYRVRGSDEGFDQYAGGPLDGDSDLVGRPEASELLGEQLEALGGVGNREATQYSAISVDDTNGMLLRAPVDSGSWRHERPPFSTLARAERSCRSLIARRSGRGTPSAQCPVAGLDLPALRRERVSRGPSSGKRRRLSPVAPGMSPFSMRRKGSPELRVHQ